MSQTYPGCYSIGMPTPSDFHIDRTDGMSDGTNLDSRGVGDWAASTCERSRALYSAGITPTRAATALGYPPDQSKSQFAMDTGYWFEHDLLKTETITDEITGRTRQVEAAGLRRLYAARTDAYAACAHGSYIDWDQYDDPIVRRAASVQERAARRQEVAQQWILARMRGEVCDYAIMGQVQLEIPGVCRPNPDLLLIDGHRGWRVGEVKSYLDRDGLTDGVKIAKAVLQGAVSIYALRLLAEAHGLDPDLISDRVDLVFLRTGKEAASLHIVTAQAELAAVRAAVEDRERFLQQLGLEQIDIEDPQQAQAQIASIDYSYGAACEAECALSTFCSKHRDNDAVPVAVRGRLAEAVSAEGHDVARLVQLQQGAPAADAADAAAAFILRDI